MHVNLQLVSALLSITKVDLVGLFDKRQKVISCCSNSDCIVGLYRVVLSLVYLIKVLCSHMQAGFVFTIN